MLFWTLHISLFIHSSLDGNSSDCCGHSCPGVEWWNQACQANWSNDCGLDWGGAKGTCTSRNDKLVCQIANVRIQKMESHSSWCCRNFNFPHLEFRLGPKNPLWLHAMCRMPKTNLLSWTASPSSMKIKWIFSALQSLLCMISACASLIVVCRR